MPRPLQVPLTAAEQAVLQTARDHLAKPSVRERPAAILRVADGQSARAVARRGCRHPRRLETVSGWVTALRRPGCWWGQAAGARPPCPPQ